MGGPGHQPDGPRAPCDPRPARRLSRAGPRDRRRLLAGGHLRRLPERRRVRATHRLPPDYYGGFLLDPDGNSAEAIRSDRDHPVPSGCIDHLWLRVRDPQASRRFYTTIAPHAGLHLAPDAPDRVQLSGPDFSFSLVHDERPLTEQSTSPSPRTGTPPCGAFHAAALAAGYEDHGAPGERPIYHPGYYGGFVLDPDGHNVEVVNHKR